MEKLAKTIGVFIATVIGTLEDMGVLERVFTAYWRIFAKITQPQVVAAAKSNGDDDAFIKAAEKDGWGRDTAHSGVQP